MCAALSSTDWARPRPLASQETPGFGVGKLSSHLSFYNSLRVGTMQAAGRVPGFRVAGRRHCVAPAAFSEANGKRPEPRTTHPCPLTCMMLTRNGPSYPWQVSLGLMRPTPTASPRRCVHRARGTVGAVGAVRRQRHAASFWGRFGAVCDGGRAGSGDGLQLAGPCSPATLGMAGPPGPHREGVSALGIEEYSIITWYRRLSA